MNKIIAPGRIFDLGGWTDHPEFSYLEGGATLNLAIKKYAFASTEDISSGFLDMPRQSGWGSSGSLNVAQVMVARNNNLSGKTAIAVAAYIQERNLGYVCGIQDHLGAAHGGMRLYEFPKGEEINWKCPLSEGVEIPLPVDVIVHPEVPREYVEKLAERIVLVYNGGPRMSSNQKPDIRKIISENIDTLTRMRDIAVATYRDLFVGNFENIKSNIEEYFSLEKKLGDGITNPVIDRIMSEGEKLDICGRVLGAGGGSVMFYADASSKKDELVENLENLSSEVPLKIYPVEVDYEGVREMDE